MVIKVLEEVVTHEPSSASKVVATILLLIALLLVLKPKVKLEMKREVAAYIAANVGIRDTDVSDPEYKEYLEYLWKRVSVWNKLKVFWYFR